MPAALDPDAALAIHRLLNPNHPAPWRGFTDITRILERDPASFGALVDAMVGPHRAHPPDAILCPESCGFLKGFGAPRAARGVGAFGWDQAPSETVTQPACRPSGTTPIAARIGPHIRRPRRAARR